MRKDDRSNIGVLRFEKKKIDKTYGFQDSSIVSSCVVLQEKNQHIAEHEKLQDLPGIDFANVSVEKLQDLSVFEF